MFALTYTLDSDWWLLNGPVVVGLVLATAIMLTLLLTERREAARRPAERRSSPRRTGPPMSIRLAADAAESPGRSGYVIDRSEGGLRLAVREGHAGGERLMVRLDAAEDAPWVSVIVVHSRPAADYFEVGCKFESPPPQSTMALFG